MGTTLVVAFIVLLVAAVAATVALALHRKKHTDALSAEFGAVYDQAMQPDQGD